MALDVKKSDTLIAKEKAGIASIAAKYGDTSYKVPTAAIDARPVVEPSMFERGVIAEQAPVVVDTKAQEEAAAAVAAVLGEMVSEPVIEPEKPAAVAAPVVPKVEEPKNDETTKQVASLVARVAELSDKLAGYEKSARTEKAAETKPGKVVITEEEWNRDPVVAMAKFKGWTEERMARHLLQKTHPNQLDPKLAAEVLNDRTNGEMLSIIGELRAEIASMKDERTQERYGLSIEKSVAGVEDTKYPLLSDFRKKNPAAVDKRIKRAIGTGSPDAADVLKAVEDELKEEGYVASGAAESTKKADDQATKNDTAPGLTADTARGSFAPRGQAMTWAEKDAQNRAALKAKYEKRV